MFLAQQTHFKESVELWIFVNVSIFQFAMVNFSVANLFNSCHVEIKYVNI